MTAIEKIRAIETILNDKFPVRTLEVTERLRELQDSLTVNDLFMVSNGADISAAWAEKILGSYKKLGDAYDNGYIKCHYVRKYARDFKYYALTNKAKKIMGI